jgi:hypothetical protein
VKLDQRSVWIVRASVPFETPDVCVGAVGLPPLVPVAQAIRLGTRESAEELLEDLRTRRFSVAELEALGGGVARTGLEVLRSLRVVELRAELHDQDAAPAPSATRKSAFLTPEEIAASCQPGATRDFVELVPGLAAGDILLLRRGDGVLLRPNLNLTDAARGRIGADLEGVGVRVAFLPLGTAVVGVVRGDPAA